MDSADNGQTASLPLACTLGPDDGAARMARWKAVSAKGRLSARHSGHVVEVRYQSEPGIRDELHALAAAERRCCSFADWQVTDAGDQLVLRISADPGHPDDIAVFAALFRAD